jgi:hypothetical protein
MNGPSLSQKEENHDREEQASSSPPKQMKTMTVEKENVMSFSKVTQVTLTGVLTSYRKRFSFYYISYKDGWELSVSVIIKISRFK